jgi:dienelactone hydrolase
MGLRRIHILHLTFLLFVTDCFALETVHFTSFDVDENNSPLVLVGLRSSPGGKGPFPGVVLLHGSGGIKARRDADWVKRLTSWGYVTLQVDSFGPRGASPAEVIKRSKRVSHDSRAKDAHGALRYLSKQHFVDPNRIAVMGWSHGGLSAIVSVLESHADIGFRAAIAFYPFCNRSLNWVNAPLLILAGELDDWCPVSYCKDMVPAGKTSHDVTLKIYPDAYHDFDWPGIDKMVKGHRVKYNAQAATEAIQQVKFYLSQHL